MILRSYRESGKTQYYFLVFRRGLGLKDGPKMRNRPLWCPASGV
jgi:hypothetical protein